MQHTTYPKSALIASVTIWVLLAICYLLNLIPINQTSLISSLLLLTFAGLFFSRQAWKRTWIATYLMVGIIGCTIEGIWIATCRPYGCFSYSDLLWPKFFSTFPFLLLGVWPFLVLSIAHLIPKQYTWKHFITLWIALLLFLDLALDPVHIHQWIWSYAPTVPNRFGVPLQNFIWRIFTGGLSMWVVSIRKNTILYSARYYSGITLLILFWIQFLVLIF